MGSACGKTHLYTVLPVLKCQNSAQCYLLPFQIRYFKGEDLVAKGGPAKNQTDANEYNY